MSHVFVWRVEDVVGLTVLAALLLGVLGIVIWTVIEEAISKIRGWFK